LFVGELVGSFMDWFICNWTGLFICGLVGLFMDKFVLFVDC